MAGIEFRCFVGGLAWATDDNALEKAFSQFGEIAYSKVMTDRETGRSRGFGFVSYSSEESMRAAIEGMNGKDLDGRNIVVNEAQSRNPGGGGGGRGGGFQRREGGGGGGYGSGGGGGYQRREGGSGGDGYGSGGGGGGYGSGGGGGYQRREGGSGGDGYGSGGGGGGYGSGGGGGGYGSGGGGGGGSGGDWRS